VKDHIPDPGDVFDVFVVRGKRNGRLVGHLYKATAIWNGQTDLMPYSRSPDLGGFAISTSQLKYGITHNGREIHWYARPKRSRP
jgi:hypothetical protein